MARVLVVGGLAALAFAVYSIADCLLTERDRVRALPRWLWVVLIVVLPVVGGLLWFLLGRGGVPVTPSGRTIGPDDDPEFLRRAGRRSIEARPRPDEPDWRQLEQELALDSDPDDDGEGRRR